MLNCEEEAVVFEGTQVRRINSEQAVSLTDIAYQSQVGNSISAESTATHSSPVSPPPYMVGMVEIELDKLTRKGGYFGLHGSCGLWHPHQPGTGKNPDRRRHRSGHWSYFDGKRDLQ